VVEGRRAEGGGSLHALLVRRGGMGKERTAVAIEALHRGTADNFGVKKWKGKGRGPARRATRGGEEGGGSGRPVGHAAGGWHGVAAHAGREQGRGARGPLLLWAWPKRTVIFSIYSKKF
jgi:hypothetical protein